MDEWHAEATAGAALTLYLDLMRQRAGTGGKSLTASFGDGGRVTKDPTVPDDKLAWLLSVGIVLKALRSVQGPVAKTILLDHLGESIPFFRIAMNLSMRVTTVERIALDSAEWFASELSRRGLWQFVIDQLPKPKQSNSCLVESDVLPTVHGILALEVGAPAALDLSTFVGVTDGYQEAL